MYSLVSTEIKQCDAFNPKLIVPNIVIDAKGAPDSVGRFTIWLAVTIMFSKCYIYRSEQAYYNATCFLCNINFITQCK